MMSFQITKLNARPAYLIVVGATEFSLSRDLRRS